MPLDPYNLTPNASINRAKLMSAPGLPQAWQGKTAYQVMGHYILVQRIHEAFPDLANQPDPIPAFNQHYLAHNHPAALAIADEMGLAIGCLLFILKQGEPVNRDARPEWDDSYWTHWGSIQHIAFGGGIMAGLLGRHMLTHVARMLDGLLSLSIADYPAALPLIGAARMTSDITGSAWVFDFGGTNVKRAHALYTNGSLMALEQLPSLAIPVLNESDAVFNFMVQTISNIVSKPANPADPLQINISLANYVRHCQLASDNPYGRLAVLGENICLLLSEAIATEVNFPVAVSLVHDGTAAAKAYAGAAYTAVITVGTALGMGFPPPTQSVCPLDDNFSVKQNLAP